MTQTTKVWCVDTDRSGTTKIRSIRTLSTKENLVESGDEGTGKGKSRKHSSGEDVGRCQNFSSDS